MWKELLQTIPTGCLECWKDYKVRNPLQMKPKEISEFSDTALSILWDDGHQSIYLYEDLRKHCPCASCDQIRKSTQEKSSFKHAIPITIDNPEITPRSIEPVGR